MEFKQQFSVVAVVGNVYDYYLLNLRSDKYQFRYISLNTG